MKIKHKSCWYHSLAARIIPIVFLLCSTHFIEAAGFLGASYEDCVAAWGQPIGHTYDLGGDEYKFRTEQWENVVIFHGRTVACIEYSKADSSPLSSSDIEALKNNYGDGLAWIQQRKELRRSDHQVYIDEKLAEVAVYTAEFRRSARSR
jgi:hypothetical protein